MGKSSKLFYCRLLMAVFGKSLRGVYKIDARMRSLVAELAEEYMVSISISGVTTKLAFSCGKTGIKIYKLKNMPLVSDLNISFKNIELALPMLLGRKGVMQAYSEHDLTMQGDIACAMTVVDMISLVKSYLFPNRMIAKFMDKSPHRQSTKGRLYAFLVLGI